MTASTPVATAACPAVAVAPPDGPTTGGVVPPGGARGGAGGGSDAVVKVASGPEAAPSLFVATARKW
jgi:hypothetical protein